MLSIAPLSIAGATSGVVSSATLAAAAALIAAATAAGVTATAVLETTRSGSGFGTVPVVVLASGTVVLAKEGLVNCHELRSRGR